MARFDIGVISPTGIANFTGAGTNFLVEANNGHLYLFYINNSVDPSFVKSTTNGIDWSSPTTLYTGTCTAISVWYDRWSGLTSDLIHIAFIDSGNDDAWYVTVDTANSDAISTPTAVHLGATTATGGALSITRSRGGNVYMAAMIDAGVEGGFYRLPSANVPNGAWDVARTTVFEGATQDQIYLVPGFAVDDNDIMAIFWDASADEISRKVYDDVDNTWTETSIATGMVDQAAASNFPHFNIAVDLTNDQILLAAWSAVDAVNADLRFWTISEAAITEKTNVVLNSSDDQGLCAVQIDAATQDWYVFYCGKSDGTETFNTNTNIYFKKSTDDGATWSAEAKLTNYSGFYRQLLTVPRTTNHVNEVAGFEANTALIILSKEISIGSGGEYGYGFS